MKGVTVSCSDYMSPASLFSVHKSGTTQTVKKYLMLSRNTVEKADKHPCSLIFTVHHTLTSVTFHISSWGNCPECRVRCNCLMSRVHIACVALSRSQKWDNTNSQEVSRANSRCCERHNRLMSGVHIACVALSHSKKWGNPDGFRVNSFEPGGEVQNILSPRE